MISAERISKFYGSRQVLHDLSFTIESHEVVGFLGLNGAGKTTVLKILSGLILPSSGQVVIDGLESQEHVREVKRKIGFLPDRPPLYVDMTVHEQLLYGARLHQMPHERIAERLRDVLELTQLSAVADQVIATLSHGYRQRVGIALAIMHEPALVILDEPISGLDPEQIVGMRNVIRSLAEHHTVLISSHILAEISQTCDRLLVLNRGAIVAQGAEAELRQQSSGGVVEMAVRCTEQGLMNIVMQVPGATSFLPLSAEGDLQRFSVHLATSAAREQLVRTLVEHHIGIHRLIDKEGGDLESLFLRLTQGVAVEQGGQP